MHRFLIFGLAFSLTLAVSAHAQTVKISQLPAATSSVATDEYPINQGGTTKKVTLSTMGGYYASLTQTLTNKTINGANNTLTVRLANDVTGALPVGNGGTGLTATPSNGQLAIGNGTGFSLATLTAGSGISITNGSGSITITNTGGGGGGGLPGQTGNAGFFLTTDGTNATWSPLRLAGISGSPSAGELYSNGNTVRYRDSGNTERIILNSGDNLANLANLTTARNNLGLGSGTVTDGDLLIGSTSTGQYTRAKLTAGTNVTITNAGGSITIAASGGGGGSLPSQTGQADKVLRTDGTNASWGPVLKGEASTAIPGSFTYNSGLSITPTWARYAWYQVGKMVFFQYRMLFSSTASVASIQFQLPSTVPAPAELASGTAPNGAFLAEGIAAISGGETNAGLSNGRFTRLVKDSASSTGYYIRVESSSSTLVFAEGSISYIVP